MFHVAFTWWGQLYNQITFPDQFTSINSWKCQGTLSTQHYLNLPLCVAAHSVFDLLQQIKSVSVLRWTFCTLWVPTFLLGQFWTTIGALNGLSCGECFRELMISLSMVVGRAFCSLWLLLGRNLGLNARQNVRACRQSIHLVSFLDW